MYLVKLKSGNYSPYDTSDHDESGKVITGDVVKATKSRNYQFHKKAFALLNLGHQNQDKYELFEVYRKVITIRAGYYDEAPTKNGEVYFIPKSLSYENMSTDRFDKWYQDVLGVISSDLSTAPKNIEDELINFY